MNEVHQEERENEWDMLARQADYLAGSAGAESSEEDPLSVLQMAGNVAGEALASSETDEPIWGRERKPDRGSTEQQELSVEECIRLLNILKNTIPHDDLELARKAKEKINTWPESPRTEILTLLDAVNDIDAYIARLNAGRASIRTFDEQHALLNRQIQYALKEWNKAKDAVSQLMGEPVSESLEREELPKNKLDRARNEFIKMQRKATRVFGPLREHKLKSVADEYHRLKSEFQKSMLEAHPGDYDQLVQKALELEEQEQHRLAFLMEDGESEGLFHKLGTAFERFWRNPKTLVGRIAIGSGIALAGVGGVSAFLGYRTAVSCIGGYMGMKAMLERGRVGFRARYLGFDIGGSLSHRGLIDDLDVCRREDPTVNLEEKIKALSDDDLQKEIARLGALGIAKRTNPRNAGRFGSATIDIGGKLFDEQKRRLGEKLKTNGSDLEANGSLLAEALAFEQKAHLTLLTNEGINEGFANTLRTTLAVGMGGMAALTTALSGGIIKFGRTMLHLDHGNTGIDTTASSGGIKTPDLSPSQSVDDALPSGSGPEAVSGAVTRDTVSSVAEAVVGSKDNLWKLIEHHLDVANIDNWQTLTPEQRTVVIDFFKDKFADLQAHDMKTLKDVVGITSGDIDKLTIGQTIHLDHVMGDASAVKKMIETVQHLTPEQLEAIKHNNALLKQYLIDHPGTFMSSEKVHSILEGTHAPKPTTPGTLLDTHTGHELIGHESTHSTVGIDASQSHITLSSRPIELAHDVGIDASPVDVVDHSGTPTMPESLPELGVPKGVSLTVETLTNRTRDLLAHIFEKSPGNWNVWKGQDARRFLKWTFPNGTPEASLQQHVRRLLPYVGRPRGGFFFKNETVVEYIDRAIDTMRRIKRLK